MQFSKDFILRREHLPGMVILSKCVVPYHCSQNLPGQQELWTWFCSLCLNLILMALTWHCGGSMHTTSHCFLFLFLFVLTQKERKTQRWTKPQKLTYRLILQMWASPRPHVPCGEEDETLLCRYIEEDHLPVSFCQHMLYEFLIFALKIRVRGDTTELI